MMASRFLLVGSALALAGGCSHSPKTPSSVESAPPAPNVVSQWSFHPAAPRGLAVRMDLGDAIRLFAGKGGERWLVDAREGNATAAPVLADEDLVAITQPGDDTFAFIGRQGTIFVSKTPLGPFSDIRRLDPPPLRVAAAGKSIVVIRWDGTVARSTDAGKTFSEVPFDGARPFDVAAAKDGRAMILGYPEQLWLSRDHGATWKRAASATIGAGFVGLDGNDSLMARGITKSIAWRSQPDPAKSPELEVTDRPFELPLLDLLADLEAGPSAASLVAGRAALTGTQYVEVARREDTGPWFLARGPLADRLDWIPIPDSDDCKHMTIGANGRRIVLGCMAGARRGGVLFPALRVMLSRDGGSTFSKKRATVLAADEESVSLTVLRDDTLIISGACKPDARGVCSPTTPMRVVSSVGTKTLQFDSTEAVKMPPIVGRVTRVIAGADEKHLYATAQLAGRRQAILVSDDRGESFRAVVLDLSNTDVAKAEDIKELLGNSQPGKLTLGQDGKLSWILHTQRGALWVVAGAGGQVLSARLGPEDQPNIEAAGSVGIAFGDDDGNIVESSDGGATFNALTRLPFAPEGRSSDTWCDVGGCVFEESFSRVGWGSAQGGIQSKAEPNPDKTQSDKGQSDKTQFDKGQSDKTQSDKTQSDKGQSDKTQSDKGQSDKGPSSVPMRTPIVCEFIDSATGSLDNVVEFPDAANAQRGSVAWSALIVDRATAAVQVAHGTVSPKHAVRPVTLFPPSPTPTRVAVYATPQAEGAAALRYTVVVGPDGKPTVGSPLRRIEVAWDHQFEGPVQRAVIADAGTLRAGDATMVAGAMANAAVDMLSVAPGGIHVCPHGECDRPEDRITFLRGRGAADSIRMPPWPRQGLGGGPLALSHHVMHVGGKHIPIAIQDTLSVLVRARQRPDGAYDFPALGLAPWKKAEMGLSVGTYWAYKPGLMGLSHTVYEADRGMAYSHVLHFDTDEGVAKTTPAPTQRDVTDPPQACTAEQRTGSFRVPSPAMKGTQHPVLVEHDGRKELLYTQLAVLHGSPSAACVSVFDARTSQSDHRRALIPIGAMDRSWLLSQENGKLTWQGMRCRFQVGASLDGAGEGPPPPPATKTTSSKRPATEADCGAIFDKIFKVAPTPVSPATLSVARGSFVQACLGKPVDMECVSAHDEMAQIISNCMEL